MVAISFNATGVKPNAALEAIPTGVYPVVITSSEKKPTSKGTGNYIQIEMTVQGGEFDKRKVFDRLNIENPNQTAVDIAYATLSAICHVTGRLDIKDTTQLHGIPFKAVVVKLERNDQPGTMTNEVKGYKDINGNDPGFAGNSGAQAAAAPQPTWAQQAAAPAAAPTAAPVQQAYVAPATTGPVLNALGGVGFDPATGQPLPPVTSTAASSPAPVEAAAAPAPASAPPAGPAGAATSAPPWVAAA